MSTPATACERAQAGTNCFLGCYLLITARDQNPQRRCWRCTRAVHPCFGLCLPSSCCAVVSCVGGIVARFDALLHVGPCALPKLLPLGVVNVGERRGQSSSFSRDISAAHYNVNRQGEGTHQQIRLRLSISSLASLPPHPTIQ